MNERYEELKSKGWSNLKSEERKEFQKLKKLEQDAPSEPKVETPKVETHSKTTKEILDECPKVNFLIPLGEGENPGAYDTVQMNCSGLPETGYKLTIQKGVMVEIPKPCAELLAAKYRIIMEAGKGSRIDRRSDVSQALN